MFTVLRHRNMALLWVGQLVSLTGDWLLIVALPFYIFQLTGSTLQTGIMFLVEILPRILFGSLAGVFVDRWDRRYTMLAADLLRAAILLCLLFVHTCDLLWLIYIVAMLQSLISQFFLPASGALIPHLVAPDELVAANSLSSFNDAVTRFIGPPLGGFLLATSGLLGVVWLDSATYLFSALMIFLIALPYQQSEQSAQPSQQMRNIWLEWLEGLRVMRQSRILVGLFTALSIFFLAQGIVNVSVIVFIERVLHGGAPLYGWLITAQGVGSLVGALLIGSLSKSIRPVFLMVPAMFIGCLSILFMVNIPIVALVLILIALVGIFLVGFFVLAQTLLQKYSTAEYRGRFLGTFNMISSLMMLLGVGLASLLGNRISSVWLLDGVACLFVLCGLVTLRFLWNVQLVTSPPTSQHSATESQAEQFG